jgi:hypothetical protein
MKMVAIVFVAVLFGLQNTHLGTEKKTAPPYRAESSAYVVRGKDAWTYVTENRSFRFAEVLGDTGDYEAVLLLEETYHNERTDGIEGMQGNATVKAWTVKRDGEHEQNSRTGATQIGNRCDIGRHCRPRGMER